MSVDSGERQGEFAQAHALPYPLVSDVEGRISDAYGVRRLGGWLPNKRVTFVVRRDGVVEEVIQAELDIDHHIDQALDTLSKLQSK